MEDMAMISISEKVSAICLNSSGVKARLEFFKPRKLEREL